MWETGLCKEELDLKQQFFSSLRVFGLLSLSLLLFPNVSADMSSGLLRRTWEPSRNFELRPFIESTGVACSVSVRHNRVQALSTPVLLLACSQDWTGNLQMIVSLAA